MGCCEKVGREDELNGSNVALFRLSGAVIINCPLYRSSRFRAHKRGIIASKDTRESDEVLS